MAETVPDQIHKIFSRQQENSKKVGLSTHEERIGKLRRLRDAILKNRDRIKQAIYLDFRKSPQEVDLTEIYPAVAEIRHTIKNLRFWMKPVKVPNSLATIGAKCEVTYQPKGVCLIISPWNYPFQLAIGPLISAIAAGNCVCLKPSEFSPHTSELIQTIFSETFEEGEVAVFQGDHDIAQQLLELPFNHIFFTGSPLVGRIIMTAAAKHLASVTLELGGKSPVVIDQEADLESAARKIIWGKLINAGQTCIAPDYVLVPKRKAEAFIDCARQSILECYGNLEEIARNPDYCRIINSRHFSRIEAVLEDALDSGGKLEFGGIMAKEDLYLSPTVISNPSLESKLMQEEIFGPLLPVVTYEDSQEILEIIRSRPRPLVLYIFSPRESFIEHILANTHSGDVVINDVVTHYANVKLPFGGINNSGIGKTHGQYGFREFSHLRSVMRQGRFAPSQVFYPPYGRRIKKIMELILK